MKFENFLILPLLILFMTGIGNTTFAHGDGKEPISNDKREDIDGRNFRYVLITTECAKMENSFMFIPGAPYAWTTPCTEYTNIEIKIVNTQNNEKISYSIEGNIRPDFKQIAFSDKTYQYNEVEKAISYIKESQIIQKSLGFFEEYENYGENELKIIQNGENAKIYINNLIKNANI